MSDPEHIAAARTLRCERIAVLRPAEQRALSDYDTALGLDGLDGTGGVMATRTASAMPARDLAA